MDKVSIRLTALLAVSCLLILQGCTTAAQKSAGMRQFLEQGRPDLALVEVEKNAEKEGDVMENMNRGILRSMTGDYQGSNDALEKAKNEIEALYATSITKQAGAVIVNDEAISFDGDRFEQVLIHAYMALNYLAESDMDAAAVEIRQADVKMMEWGDTPEEDPFMRYLAGIIYEALGEDDEALVSYRRAVEVYKATNDKQGLGVPLQAKKDLLRMLAKNGLWSEYKQYRKELGMQQYQAPNDKGYGELVVVFNNGLVPQRQMKAFQTYSSELALNIRIAVPDYPNPPSYVNQVQLNVGPVEKLLEPVENLDGLARAALSSDMPVITARAIARAVVKKKSEKEAGDRGGALGQLAMLVLNTATEIADTRCWNTLPQMIQVGRVFLKPGQYDLKLNVIGRTGAVVDSITAPVSIVAGKKTILNKYWVAPRPYAGNVAGSNQTAAAPAATGVTSN